MRLNKLTWAAILLVAAIALGTWVRRAHAIAVGGIGAYQYNVYALAGTSTDVLLGGDIGQFRHCFQIFNVGPNEAWCTVGTMTAGNAVATSTNGVPILATGLWQICPSSPAASGGGQVFQIPAFDVACIAATGAGTTLIALDF